MAIETGQAHAATMNRMKSKISSPPSSLLAQSSVKSLLLKHEILSPECDLFRACLPRRVYVKRVGRMMAVVVGVGAGCWWWRVKEIVGGVLMIITILALIFMLSRVIEGTPRSVNQYKLTSL